MRVSHPCITLLLALLFTAAAKASETWLLALGERDEDPQWGEVRLVAPPNWEELKEGSGGLTTHGLITTYISTLFAPVRVTLAPFIADLTWAENSAMRFAKLPRKFYDVLEILLLEFDDIDSKPRRIATVQVLLSAAPFGAPAATMHVLDVECVRLATISGGRKGAFLKLTKTLRERHEDRMGKALPESPAADASDQVIAAYWRNTLLADLAAEIEEAHCNSARGLVIFQIKDGAGQKLQRALNYLSDWF
jgi:hypothetical protein